MFLALRDKTTHEQNKISNKLRSDMYHVTQEVMSNPYYGFTSFDDAIIQRETLSSLERY